MEFSALQISESDTGVVVAECSANSAAYKMGIRPTDFIQRADDRVVRNIRDFFGATSPHASGRKMKIKLCRALQEMTIEIGGDGKERGRAADTLDHN